MKRIIKELLANEQHELNQIGLTPRTNFIGNQEEHDAYHMQKACEYQIAAKILSATFQVRDWLVSEVHCFDTFSEAESKFKELLEETKEQECDVQLMSVIDEFNNVK